MKKIVLSLITALAAFSASHAAEVGGKSLVLKNKQGLAIQGYDPVAYFTDNKAVKGNAKFNSEHEGAKYQFVSAEHKAMFEANPEKYAPAYGGYCGYAASIDRLSPISPEWFQIEDGKLILQHNQKAFDLAKGSSHEVSLELERRTPCATVWERSHAREAPRLRLILLLSDFNWPIFFTAISRCKKDDFSASLGGHGFLS